MKTDDISNLRRIVSDWRNSRYQINERIAISELLDHADEQAKQIATLKAALVQERANKLSCDGKAFHDYTIDAAAQLAKEYPEIFAEE
jgi:hypothetical protein